MHRQTQARYRTKRKQQMEQDRRALEELKERLAAVESDWEQLSRSTECLEKTAALGGSMASPAIPPNSNQVMSQFARVPPPVWSSRTTLFA